MSKSRSAKPAPQGASPLAPQPASAPDRPLAATATHPLVTVGWVFLLVSGMLALGVFKQEDKSVLVWAVAGMAVSLVLVVVGVALGRLAGRRTSSPS